MNRSGPYKLCVLLSKRHPLPYFSSFPFPEANLRNADLIDGIPPLDHRPHSHPTHYDQPSHSDWLFVLSNGGQWQRTQSQTGTASDIISGRSLYRAHCHLFLFPGYRRRNLLSSRRGTEQRKFNSPVTKQKRSQILFAFGVTHTAILGSNF